MLHESDVPQVLLLLPSLLWKRGKLTSAQSQFLRRDAKLPFNRNYEKWAKLVGMHLVDQIVKFGIVKPTKSQYLKSGILFKYKSDNPRRRFGYHFDTQPMLV